MKRLFFAVAMASVAMTCGQADALELERIAGHVIEVKLKDYERALFVDGEALHSNSFISLKDIYSVGSSLVIVGSTSAGGSACVGSPFVVAFTENAAARFYGPLDNCVQVDHRYENGALHFQTESIPGRDTEEWTWTPQSDFVKLPSRPYEAPQAPMAMMPQPEPVATNVLPEAPAQPTAQPVQTETVDEPQEPVATASIPKQVGWADLKDQKLDHPAELFLNQEVIASIGQTLGDDFEVLQDLMNGEGKGRFKGDDYIGTVCRANACKEEAGILYLSPADRKVYFAWKPQGKPIIVYPAPIKLWPGKAQVELKEWAKVWK